MTVAIASTSRRGESISSSIDGTINNNNSLVWFLFGTVAGCTCTLVVSYCLNVLIRKNCYNNSSNSNSSNSNSNSNSNSQSSTTDGTIKSTVQQQQKNQIPAVAPRRYGAAIQLKPEYYIRYRELHDKVWPEVLQRMYLSNIRNFTIYYHKETNTLYQHFEWIGHWLRTSNNSNNNVNTNNEMMTSEEEERIFQADMDAIGNDPITRLWWKECEPCQVPFGLENVLLVPPSEGGKGPWWTSLECVSHCGYWPIAYSNVAHDPDFVPLTIANQPTNNNNNVIM